MAHADNNNTVSCEVRSSCLSSVLSPLTTTMTHINIDHVLDMIRDEFRGSTPHSEAASQEEADLAAKMKGKLMKEMKMMLIFSPLTDMLFAAMSGEAEEIPTLDYDEDDGDKNQDDDFSESEDSPSSSQGATGSEWEGSSPMKPARIDPYPEAEKKREILSFWRSVKKGAKKVTRGQPHKEWKSMVNRYSKLANVSERTLYEWEERGYGEEGSLTRKEKMMQINKSVRMKFEEARDHGIPVHENDLRRWALETNDSFGEQKIIFVASRGWLNRFKLTNRIVDRKITKFVSRVNMESAGEKMKQADDFVKKIRSLSLTHLPSSIFNTDQSGFEKEMHKQRTLEIRGTQQVMGVVQSVGATTHSYTIQPIISMSGRLIKPMMVILQEASGSFGPNVMRDMWKSEELFVLASKSGKITKDLLKKWFIEVYFPAAGEESLLLVDSLTTYRDRTEVDLETDATYTLEIIPPGTTGMIQPLDVYFFRMYKGFFRRISDHVLIEGMDFPLFQRNNILKLQAVVHHQFRSPRFTPSIKHAWSKAGYTDDQNEHVTANDFCFEKDLRHCDHCTRYALIRCGWCKERLCFDHLVVTDVHMCESYEE